jgi:hypothetical protein
VGRAGATNLDVIQEVEYVKQEARIVYLLECLQKTAPPALIFCENKADVDDIHEYLLLKVCTACLRMYAFVCVYIYIYILYCIVRVMLMTFMSTCF